MRLVTIVLGLTFAAGGLGQAQEKDKQDKQDKLGKRYSYELDDENYPQKSPQEAMLSVVKAIGNKKIEYMLAHLADPEFVDAKVAKYKKLIEGGKEEGKILVAFQRLVNETREHFLEDPEVVAELRRFAKEAEWKSEENTAMGSVKNIVGRHVFMKRVGDRWFLEQRQR